MKKLLKTYRFGGKTYKAGQVFEHTVGDDIGTIGCLLGVELDDRFPKDHFNHAFLVLDDGHAVNVRCVGERLKRIRAKRCACVHGCGAWIKVGGRHG